MSYFGKNLAFFYLFIYFFIPLILETTLYRKPTHEQAVLHAKTEQPRSLKSSIPYSQALRQFTKNNLLYNYRI